MLDRAAFQALHATEGKRRKPKPAVMDEALGTSLGGRRTVQLPFQKPRQGRIHG